MSFDIRPIDTSLSEAAFLLATQVFAESSTLHRALNISLDEYRDYLRPSFQQMLAEGLSVAALRKENNALVGCIIATDFHRVLNQEPSSHPTFAPLSALTDDLCQRYSRHRNITPGEVLLIDMGAVAKTASGKGLYQKMRAAAQKAAFEKGYRSVVGELSSAATQHVVLDRLGHQKMAELFFDSFTHRGRRPFEAIKEPKSIVLAEGAL